MPTLKKHGAQCSRTGCTVLGLCFCTVTVGDSGWQCFEFANGWACLMAVVVAVSVVYFQGWVQGIWNSQRFQQIQYKFRWDCGLCLLFWGCWFHLGYVKVRVVVCAPVWGRRLSLGMQSWSWCHWGVLVSSENLKCMVVREWLSQDALLWGTCVDGGWGHGCTCSDWLWSVTEEVVDEGWGDMKLFCIQ